MEYPSLIQLKKYRDERGWFRENFNSRIGIENNFRVVQDNISFSKKGVVRGLHYQPNQKRIVHVISGQILDVSVDVTSGKIYTFLLRDTDDTALYIPSGYAHGFSSIQDNTIVLYKTNQDYDPSTTIEINPLDPELNIDWKVDSIILSEKDRNSKTFKSLFNTLK